MKLENRILEILNETDDSNLNEALENVKTLKEEDDVPSFGSDVEDDNPTEETDKPDGGQESGQKKDGESEDEAKKFEADNVRAFVTKTKTGITIAKEVSEPSPLYGPHDVEKHEKHRIEIKNDKGSVKFYIWGEKKDEEGILKELAKACSSVKNGSSLEEFVKTFGYEKAEKSKSQKMYDGCRKLYDTIKKMYSDDEIECLIELGMK